MAIQTDLDNQIVDDAANQSNMPIRDELVGDELENYKYPYNLAKKGISSAHTKREVMRIQRYNEKIEYKRKKHIRALKRTVLVEEKSGFKSDEYMSSNSSEDS